MPELLVATVMSLLVLAAGVTLLTSGIRDQPQISDRVAQIQQARVLSERITRELRQGSNAQSADPSQLMILTYVPHAMGTSCGSTTGGTTTTNIRCRVFYSCSAAGSCTRTECPSTALTPGLGCGSPTTVVTGLADNQVFTFSPRIPGQAYVALRLAFASVAGHDAITIQDGVALRNPPLGGP